MEKKRKDVFREFVCGTPQLPSGAGWCLIWKSQRAGFAGFSRPSSVGADGINSIRVPTHSIITALDTSLITVLSAQKPQSISPIPSAGLQFGAPLVCLPGCLISRGRPRIAALKPMYLAARRPGKNLQMMQNLLRCRLT